MPYTWRQFNDAVKVLLTVDKDRLGIAEPGGFNDLMIRQAVLEVQSVVEFYRQGHQQIYAPSDFTPVGACSSLDLPEGAQVRDAMVIRSKDPVAPLPGTTTANHTTSIIGAGTKFLSACSVPPQTFLGVGDKIKLTGGSYAQVTDISSDTALTVDSAIGDGSVQAIYKQVEFRYPVLPWGWEKREELLAGQKCVNDNNAFAAISPQGNMLLYPALQVLDRDGEAQVLELNWDGIKLDFADNDTTPFDEPMTLCVADYVKGQIAKHVERDIMMFGVFLGLGTGSYYAQRRKLYLDCKNKTRLRR